MQQQTLQTRIQMKGVASRCGKVVRMRLSPAPEYSGVVFEFVSQGKHCKVEANLQNAMDMDGLVLGTGEHTLYGVTPLLAALYGLGIDNVRIQLDADEVPRADGSAAPFVFLIESAGIRQQSVKRREIKPDTFLHLISEEGWARFMPSSGLRIASLNNEDGIGLTHQDTVMEISKASFVSRLCHAGAQRFEGMDESHQLAKELIKNKQILQSLAIISLLNARVHGTYIACRAGLKLGLRLVRQIETEVMDDAVDAEAFDEMPLLVNAR